MWSTFLALVPLITLQGPADVGQSAKLLTGVQPTEHFEIRYRPGSRAAASIDRLAREVEREYAGILATLAIDGKVNAKSPFHLFVYDDVEELAHVTETG